MIISLQWTEIELYIDEDVTGHGECCPYGCDSSLNLLVLGFVSGSVSLSHIDVAFNILDLFVVDMYWCVSFHHHFCVYFLMLVITI